jgi:hypothetical protein
VLELTTFYEGEAVQHLITRSAAGHGLVRFTRVRKNAVQMSYNERANNMKNSVSTSNGREAVKPTAPLWIFKIANPIVSAWLRSPLHSVISNMLMRITYRGRKSGRVFTRPIGYFKRDKDELMAFTSARWWVNALDDKPVTLLLIGQQIEAIRTPIQEREAVVNTLEQFVRRLGAKMAQRLPIGLPRDREPRCMRKSHRCLLCGLASVIVQETT